MSAPAPPSLPTASVVAVALLCGAALFLFLADLFLPPVVVREWWWAGFQVHSFPVPYRVLAALLPLAVLLAPWHVLEEVGAVLRRWRHAAIRAIPHPAGWGALLVLALWAGRTCTLAIGDAAFYVGDLIPRESLAERGIFLNYDSVGATWLYTRGYHYAHHMLRFDPLTWYQFSGTACLLVFLWWVWLQRNRGMTLLGPAALAVALTGNWTQHTMGPPEHYAQVLLCTMVFGVLGVEALRGRAPLWKPCLAYCLGAFFHLIIAWTLPALVWLIWRRWREEPPAGRQAALCAILLPAFATGYLCYWYGFDLSFLSAGHGASGGKLIPFLDANDPYTGAMFQYDTFDPRHLVHIVQQILLMGWPGVLLLAAGAPLISRARLRHDPAIGFLGLIVAGTFLLNLLWHPDLGFWRDQDLFALIGLAFCLLGAWLGCGPHAERWHPATRRRLLAMAIVGGLAWRIPVLIWHGPMSSNYHEPEKRHVEFPFSDLEGMEFGEMVR